MVVLFLPGGLSRAGEDVLWIDYHLDINDGDSYGELFVGDPGSVDMYGGTILVKLQFGGSTTGNIYGGEMDWLWTWHDAEVNIYGGEIDWLWTDDESVVNIYGGSLNVLASFPDSTVYLYAYDTAYHPDGGLDNGPWIEGKYLGDDSAFSFNFNGDDCVPQLVVVPEPITLVFLGLGCLVLRKRK